MVRLLAIVVILAGYVAMDALVAAKLWLLVRPVRLIRQWRTRRKMRSWAAEHPDEVLEDFNSPEEGAMLNGYKTYLGIAAAAVGVALGWFGIGETESAELSAKIVASLDQLLTVGGLLLAAYGRAKTNS